MRSCYATRASAFSTCDFKRFFHQRIQQTVEIEYRIRPVAKAKQRRERTLQFFRTALAGSSFAD